MPQQTSTPRELARGLLGRDAAGGGTRALSAATAHEIFERLYTEFSRWVGIDGGFALFSRALATTRIEHPALKPLRLHARADRHLDRITEAVQTYGDKAVVEGLEAMLVTLIKLLGLLIGDDMTTTLVLQATPGSGGHDGSTARSRRAAP